MSEPYTEGQASRDVPRAEVGTISCRGVRTHNLKSIDVDFPLGKWIAVTGVSGSGKSSLAFDTVFAESQRRFLETLGTYERQFLQGLPEGEFDSIDHIPPAIALKQTNRTGDPRSLVATAADLGEPLRALFAALMEHACLHCGTPVTINEPADLEHYLGELFSENPEAIAYLTLGLSLPHAKSERSMLVRSLQSEGYHRLLLDGGELIDTDAVPPEVASAHIVLDRLSAEVDRDEMRNRVATAWSQVRYSPRFYSIEVKSSQGHVVSFATQPVCPRCRTTTRVLQSSDLDWESVLGHCPTCGGLGNVARIDPNKVIPNPELSIAEGAIKPWSTQTFQWMNDALCAEMKRNKIDAKVPYRNLPADVLAWIWTGEGQEGRFQSRHRDTVFINEFFGYLEQERYKSSSRILLAKYRHYVTCSECGGERLSPSGRNARCAGMRFPELMQLEVRDLRTWVEHLKENPAYAERLLRLPETYAEVERKLSLLDDLGLGSCSLWRRCKTLSGGEFQRVLLSRVVGNGLTDALYVLDEPSVGLGELEIPKLVEVIRNLRDLGNTVLMVDHDPTLVTAADLWIELGPGGGRDGGKIMPHKGPLPQSAQPVTTRAVEKRSKNVATEFFTLKGFSALNCHSLEASLPVGRLTVIAGPSGAGKSTLLRLGFSAALDMAQEHGTMSSPRADLDRGLGAWQELALPTKGIGAFSLVTVDQKPLQRSITSIVATVLGVMDTLRAQFAQTQEARLQGLSASLFSFNSEGACPTCEGRGVLAEDLFFLGEVEKTCPDCHGTRFVSKAFLARWENKTIHEWLQMSIDEALQSPLATLSGGRALQVAQRLGLGYLSLGRATTALSGGEAQRLRIAGALTKGKKPLVCLLDEPSRGLSETDVGQLVSTLLDLTAQGHTFAVVEHHPSFRKAAHHVIHMGPGSGKEGGKIVRVEDTQGVS